MTTIIIENLSTMELITINTDKHFLDAIEDALYIQWELTPCAGRCSWAYPFRRGDKVKFSYHEREFVKVWMDLDGKVWVKDI